MLRSYKIMKYRGIRHQITRIKKDGKELFLFTPTKEQEAMDIEPVMIKCRRRKTVVEFVAWYVEDYCKKSNV